jgi:hypothetical protein
VSLRDGPGEVASRDAGTELVRKPSADVIHSRPGRTKGHSRRVMQRPARVDVRAAEPPPANPAMHWRPWPRLRQRPLGQPLVPSRCACVLATSALCSTDYAAPRSHPMQDP